MGRRTLGALRWAYAAGDAMSDVPEWGRDRRAKPRQAVAGLAFAEQRPIMTEDYLADDRFDTTPEIEAFVRKAGIRAVIAAPLTGEGASPLGVLSVVSREPGAYTDDRGRAAHGPRDACLDRDHQRPPHGGARPLARGHRAPRRGRGAACARSPRGSPPCASPTRSSSTSSTRRAGCCAPTAP